MRLRLLNAFFSDFVPSAGVEPTSSEPESDILSIELRRRHAKNTIFIDFYPTKLKQFNDALKINFNPHDVHHQLNAFGILNRYHLPHQIS